MESAKPKVNIITLGCAKNLYDSEQLAARLEGNYQVVHESSEATPVVIINTCGFIRDAKAESVDTILEYVERKKRGEIEKLIVTGCLSERYKKELPVEIPEVDKYFGNHHADAVASYLGVANKGVPRPGRKLATPPHYAYLKISEGCDRKCAFCAIPAIRGRHVSRTLEDLEAEARALARQGIKELILVAQDLSFYGRDLYGKRALPDLLRRLVRIDGIEWIRLQYLYPAGFPEEILYLMRDEPKICRYLDIPLQHIDNDILKAMRRGAGERQTRALLEKIKTLVPDIHVRTTFITGFPGETEEKFGKLEEFIKEMRFDRVGVFTYSAEEGTAAARLPDTIPERIKEERKARLMEIQREISLEKNLKKTGRIMRVLIDAPDDGFYWARTEFDTPEADNDVYVFTARDLTPGKFLNVRITGAEEYALHAVPADEA